MPDMYPPGEYDLAGFTVGVVEKSALVDGSQIKAGDAIIGIASSGAHSNGYSLIRRIVARVGATPDNGGFDLDVGGMKLADALMAPTTIYVKPILTLLKQQHLNGMAHITGGGLKENIIRVVPDNLGITLDSSSWKLPPLFDWLQHEGRVARDEMLRTFNCGIGYTLIVQRDQVGLTLDALEALGLTAWTIGAVEATRGDERVHIA
jgi:phosphoribosylformylglycinamidine cyclo-ligase